MAENPYDLAIFGSTPLAGLLAGLLATRHHKRVCLIGDPGWRVRLPRGIDLSVMPVTRPETWALLKDGTTETLRLLGQMRRRSGFERLDPVFAADGAAGSEALSHMRHVAGGLGYAVERLPRGAARASGDAYRLRDAVLLRRAEVVPMIDEWLAKAAVGRLDADKVGATFKRDGSVRLSYADTTIEAVRAVLADDEAILQHLDRPENDRMLLVQPMTAMLTEPTRALLAQVMVYADTGITLVQARSGAVLALGPGGAEAVPARVGRYLAGHGPLRRAGQRIFRGVATVDGAPLVGPVRGVKATVLAGLGLGGAFLAPVLARLIAGTATEAEERYFALREGGRATTARALVADYAGAGTEAHN